MGQPLTQHAFRGEISPEFYGNTRSPLHGVSLRTCKNFLPIVHGALVNRPGFLELGSLVSTGVRFKAFIFSDAQAFVLEFTAGRVRFWTPSGQVLAAGVPYEVVTPYTADDLPYLKFAQSGDVVTITRVGYAPRNLSRISNTNWTLVTWSSTPQAFFGDNGGGALNAYIATAALSPPNYSAGTTYAYGDVVLYQPGGGANPVKMYRSLGPGNVGNQPDTHPLLWVDVTYAGGQTYSKGNYVWQSTNATDGQMYISLADNNRGNTPAGTTAFWTPATDVARVPRLWQAVVTQLWRDSFGVVHETLPSAPSQVVNFAVTTDRPAVIAWGLETGGPAQYAIVGYSIYAGRNGLFGLIGTADTKALYNFNWDGSAPDFATQPPKGTDPFTIADGAGTSTPSYPAVVAYDNTQRRVFARSDKKPSTFWGSAISDFDRFDQPIPVSDADSYEWKLASGVLEEIRSARTFGQLCLFTGQGEWTAQGKEGSGITATNVQARKHSSHGSSWLDPVEAENALLFNTAKGSYIREFYFDYNSNAFVGSDITEYARHLFEGYTILSWAFQSKPYGVLWVVRSDGRLFSCTFNKAAQVVAWARHPTYGQCLQVACIPNGTEDALFLGVVRNGAPRMEILATRRLPQIADGVDAETGLTKYKDDLRQAVFLDASAKFDGRNTGATTMAVTGASYDAGDIVTVDASVASFAATDVDDQVVIIPDGFTVLNVDGTVNRVLTPVRITVTQYNSGTQVLGRLEAVLDPLYQNTPTTSWGWARDTLQGLDHLNGLSVKVLADGVVQGPFAVAGGQIGPLSPPGCIALAGLSYNSDAELLDIAADAVKPNVKAVSRVVLDVVGSSGIFCGETFEPPDDDFDEETDLMPAKLRTVEDDFGPTELVTGQVEVPIGSTWNTGGRACIRQSDPLPLTITAATRDVEVGGRGG